MEANRFPISVLLELESHMKILPYPCIQVASIHTPARSARCAPNYFDCAFVLHERNLSPGIDKGKIRICLFVPDRPQHPETWKFPILLLYTNIDPLFFSLVLVSKLIRFPGFLVLK